MSYETFNTLKISNHNSIATVALNRGSSNAMNQQMIEDLIGAFQELDLDNEVKAVILTGKDNFFTSGLDLFEIYSFGEGQIRTFWIRFLELQSILVSFKKPLLSVINGHSPAGGCIMAICSDYRIMAEGKFIIGLNELPVGIIVPDFVFQLYAFWIGNRNANKFILEGKLMNGDEALACGLVDEVCAHQFLMESAVSKINTWLSLDADAWSQTKLNIRKQLIARFHENHSDLLDIMLKQWWAPDTRKRLSAILENLKQTV